MIWDNRSSLSAFTGNTVFFLDEFKYNDIRLIGKKEETGFHTDTGGRARRFWGYFFEIQFVFHILRI
jgi:hypothetical protein